MGIKLLIKRNKRDIYNYNKNNIEKMKGRVKF